MRKLLAFAGPGYLVAVGYMDPGNWATDLAGGSKYNYTLLSVILLSNLMAILLQTLAIKLGVVTGRDLAAACRDHYQPSGIVHVLDRGRDRHRRLRPGRSDRFGHRAESAVSHSAAVGRVPDLAGRSPDSVPAAKGFSSGRGAGHFSDWSDRRLLRVGDSCFPSRACWALLKDSSFRPSQIIRDPGMLYIAIGILGATVMPHNLYLHSALVQTRDFERTPKGKREAIRFGTIDSTIALTFALLVNAAILIVSAATFYSHGYNDVAEINDAHKLLTPLLGVTGASTMFALALLASGQNSTLTGTLAGQVVMEGFLNIRLRPWLRRLITRAVAIIPAVIVTAFWGTGGTAKLLVFSQVILSMQLSFAVFPLVMFTSDPRKMGEFINAFWLKSLAWLTAALIAILNVWLLALAFHR